LDLQSKKATEIKKNTQAIFLIKSNNGKIDKYFKKISKERIFKKPINNITPAL
jgi:hypothetical protein